MKRVQGVLILFLLLAYIQGLFVPIMNNNAAHHANIALHMYLTGDYLNLIDRGMDYLDKPHLLFWLAALGYHLFGVSSFAYKFFSFVFALVGIYSTGQIGKWVSGQKTGSYAALILASAFAFILSVNDVRMDAMVVSCIAFATWQLIEFWSTNSRKSLFLSALGLALGFATKGMIAVALPALTVVLYAWQQEQFKRFLSVRWVLLLLTTVLLLLPVFYSFYVQFDMHPEKIVRGRAGNSGIGFLLVGQSLQRYTGSGWGSRASDPFYLIHTFLWAFLPWSILAFIALGSTIRIWIQTKAKSINGKVVALAATTLFVFVLVSFSKFKNDHYINILFPYFAVLTSHFLQNVPPQHYKATYWLQFFLSVVMMILVTILNTWVFPVTNLWVIVSALILFALFVYIYRTGKSYVCALWMSVAASAFSLFLLNFNFYPKLLTYQSGHILAHKMKAAGIDPDRLYYINTTDRNYSLDFSLGALPPSLTYDELKKRRDTVFLFADLAKKDTLQMLNIPFSVAVQENHYNVTTLRLKFLNPATRPQQLQPHYILRVINR